MLEVFSVLTPVGLLPIAIAGIDISCLKVLLYAEGTTADKAFDENPCCLRCCRNLLYRDGKLQRLCRYLKTALRGRMVEAAIWRKRKARKKGYFSASVFTTDLRSMGQWIQEGRRDIFETVISIEKPKYKVGFLATGTT